MKIKNVCDVFVRLSGVEIDKALEYINLFEMAIGNVQRLTRLGDCVNSDKVDDIKRLEYLAGVLAYEMYIYEVSDTDINSFKMLDITINASEKTLQKRIEVLKLNALYNAKDLLVDQNFVFRQVD